MEWAAREAAHFPAAMMELKRVAAPNGRQPAWLRRHRMTAKPGPRQQCTRPAASRRGSGAPAFEEMIAGPVRPKVGARLRAPFSLAVHSNARALRPRARSVRGPARVVHRRARSGHCWVQLLLEWMWSSLASRFSVQCRPMATVGYASLIVNQEDCVARAFACYAVNDRGAGRSPVRSRLRRPR